MKFRFVSTIAIFCMFASGYVCAQGNFSADDYKRALWMVTRFYGGQRSGYGPNWLIMEHQNPEYRTSFTQDADDGYDLEGGWFDCGDHVLFGQTFFYSVYMLVTAYNVFPEGFHDLYDGSTYGGYLESGNWDMDGGRPNGIPDVLEEIKYATDWIIKATPDQSTFYYEKGHGGNDHATWVTAGKMSTQSVEEGGEPRPMWKNPDDGSMPAFAAAALAVMSQVYRKYDEEYADLCLEHARNAYAYAMEHRTQGAGAASGGYYGAPKHPATHVLIASAEMYKATGDQSFSSDIVNNIGEIKDHFWAFDYSNAHDLAAYAVAMAVDDQKDTQLDFLKTTFLDKYSSTVNGEGVSTVGGDWGALRYPGNFAFLAALYSEARGTSAFDEFIYNQVDYILGDNNSGQSFVVGFCSGCQKEATKPHHRNVYLNDDNPDNDAKQQMEIPERNRQFGSMVGGARNSSEYVDAVNNYQTTEGGIDYNAGLLGALAYIVSKENPADTSTFTGEDPNHNISVLHQDRKTTPAHVTIKYTSHHVDFSLAKNAPIDGISVYDLSGTAVFSSDARESNIRWDVSGVSKGVYLIHLKTVDGNSSASRFVLR
ncbi:MAG: glycoside hydrolase family 9 protein [Chitinivibrionales bacterium]